MVDALALQQEDQLLNPWSIVQTHAGLDDELTVNLAVSVNVSVDGCCLSLCVAQ